VIVLDERGHRAHYENDSLVLEDVVATAEFIVGGSCPVLGVVFPLACLADRAGDAVV